MEKIENRFLDKGALLPGIQKFGIHTIKLRIGNIFSRKINPIDVVDQISPIPLLIIQGEKDPIIFKHHAEQLYKKAKEPKKLWLIQPSEVPTHFDVYNGREGGPGFFNIVMKETIDWVKQYMPPRA